ncbi:MAG TPA: hypothetical protein ENJ19_01660, partial [Gammaproteobacteria bacterium]|nr:hypothetical protein [Gammaproteobacteria bacterium]
MLVGAGDRHGSDPAADAGGGDDGVSRTPVYVFIGLLLLAAGGVEIYRQSRLDTGTVPVASAPESEASLTAAPPADVFPAGVSGDEAPSMAALEVEPLGPVSQPAGQGAQNELPGMATAADTGEAQGGDGNGADTAAEQGGPAASQAVESAADQVSRPPAAPAPAVVKAPVVVAPRPEPIVVPRRVIPPELRISQAARPAAPATSGSSDRSSGSGFEAKEDFAGTGVAGVPPVATIPSPISSLSGGRMQFGGPGPEKNGGI